jgi:Domain of unknown function (DUF4129)
MTTSRAGILLLILILALPCLGAGGPVDMTPAQYGAELDRLLAATEKLDQPGTQIQELTNELPSTWRVKTDRDAFEVSTEWLRQDLRDLEHKFDKDLQQRIHEHLAGLRADLDAYQKTSTDDSRQRALVDGILSRPEFSDLHGPNWIDRLKQRLIQLLIRLVGRAITSSIFSSIGKPIVYGLMIVAFFAVAYWVYSSIRTTTKIETILPGSLPISAREWTVWMAEARDAAQRGNWRDAIHLAYWAGISFLESQGVWRPDSARTPREYLRLMPVANEHRPTLTALTRKFELVWYAGQPADAQAFSQTLAELEELGCRLN